MLATEGADLSLFGIKEEVAFNWRQELQSVFEPILVELKRLTERPRKIERLRTDQSYYKQRLDVAENALRNVTKNRENAPTPELQQAFAAIEQRWQQRREDLSNRYTLTTYELEETLSPSAAGERDPVEALKELFSGRLLNLALAVAAAVLVYLVMRLLAGVYERRIMPRARRRGAFAARVVGLLFYLFTGLLVLLTVMAVFYVRGDWLLLGLLIIILVGAAWAMQKSLPAYLTEAKLMLNLGSVREGERLVYNGLPWRVESLNFFATLVNPLLQGGTLRIPVRALVNSYSRAFHPEEPWFPARAGDFVRLDDSTFGQVLTQTPECVQLKVLGAVKTYGIADFLAKNPLDISLAGYTLAVTFGLDYSHQGGVTGDIRDRLESDLAVGLAHSEAAPYLVSFALDFKAAASSSLDFIALATFTGAAAEHYFAFQRLLQRLIVDACNTHGFVIPFEQVTVHMANKTKD
jgi:small-conductance mechanosensitive channel